MTNDVLLSETDHFERLSHQEDRYDLLGKSIAMRIRSLEKRQRLIIEKRINDLLFEAEMEMLNVHTALNLSSPSSSTNSPAASHDPFAQQIATARFATNEEFLLPH